MRSEDYRNDPMFLRNQFSGDGVFSLPKLKIDEIDLENVRLIGYDKLNEQQTDAIVHFFLDDYKFEVLWNDPEPRLERLRQYRAVLSPDFSMYTEMPLPLKIYNTFRSRWCGAFLQANGVKVIPTVSWGAPDTFWFCFDGIPKGGTVAVSTVGVRKQKTGFLLGYDEMLRRIRPRKILCYGTPFEEIGGDVIPIDYAATNHYKKQFLSAYVAGAAHSGVICKTGFVLAEKGGRGGAAGGGSGSGGGDTSPSGNSGGDGDTSPRNKLPPNDSQLMHMFEDREGHVPDTPENRQLLEDVANDPNAYYGTDRWGKQWYARMQDDGSQIWVCTRDGVIQDGGINTTPHSYDDLTGFSRRNKMIMEAMEMFTDNYGKQGFLTLFYLLDEDWERSPSNAVGDLASEMCPYTFKERQPADIATYGDYGLHLAACLKESNKEDAETAYKAAVRMLKFYRDHYAFALDPFLSRFTLTAFQEKFATLEEEAVSLGDWTMLLRRVAEAEEKGALKQYKQS